MSDRHLILGIETSCDETGVSLIEEGDDHFQILSEKIHSQVQLHEAYGGVVPELAARAHTENLPFLLSQLLQETKIDLIEISSIAITVGPGLKGCLLSGMLFASGLASSLSVPLIPVNHIEAHVLSVLIDNPDLTFPFLALVVSGGHTEIHLVRDIGEYDCIARTSDDAAGEAFDKSANLLGIPYPGGAKLAALADSFSGTPRFSLPTVMKKAKGFSFSGLKTAISRLIDNHRDEIDNDEELLCELAASIQESIIRAILLKVERAIELTGSHAIGVSGGVSANRALRIALNSLPEVKTYFPRASHSVDNGTMIAFSAALRLKRSLLPSLPFIASPRWPIETSRMEGV